MEQERPSTPPTRRKRRVLLRVLRWLVLWPLMLLVLLIFLFYLSPVQDLIRAKAITWLREKIGTPVQLDELSIGFPAQVELRGLLIIDRSGDTLLHAAELKSGLGLMALLDGRIEIGATELTGVRAHLAQATDSTFNFGYIIAAFASGDTSAVDTSGSKTSLSLPRLQLNDVRFDMDLAPSHMQLAVRLGHLDVPLDEMDAIATRIHAGVIELADAHVDLRTIAGPEEPDPYPLLPDPFAGLDIALRELHLENVSFRMVDTGSGDSLALALRKGDILVDSMALMHQRFRIRSVEVDGIAMAMLQRGVTAADTTTAPPPAWLDQHDGFRYWVRGLDVQVNDLAITNGAFAMHQGSVIATERLFDDEHLAFDAINLRAKDLAVNDQLLTVNANELAATAADGAQLRAGMRARATPSLVALDEGSIGLGKANVRFSASAAIGDPSEAYRQPDRVPLSAKINSDLDQATLARVLEQLGIAAPAQRTNERWKSDLTLHGTMRDIDTLDVDVQGDQGSVLLMTARVKEADAWPRSTFTVDLREMKMGAGFRDIALAYAPSSVPMPQRLTATAQLKGTGTGAAGSVAISSDLGNVQGTLAAAGFDRKMPDELNADLELTNIAVARFTGNTNLTSLNAHVVLDHVRPNGVRSGTIEATLGPTLLRGQDLDGSHLVAQLDGDSIHLDLDATSPALATVLDAHLHWPAESDSVSGAFALNLPRCDLQALGLIDHPLDVSGRWDGSGGVSMKGLAAFELNGDSVLLANAGRTFRFSEFVASGLLASDSTSFSLNSNALQAEYHTNVAADSLMPLAQKRLLGWFGTDSLRSTHIDQRADLHVAIPDPRWITDVVFPDVQAIELKEFRGHWEGDAALFDIDLPELRYDGLEVTNLIMHADASRKALDGTLTVDSLQYNAFAVNGLTLTAASAPGKLTTGLRIAEPESAPRYAVDIEFQRPNEELSLHVLDGLILDTLPWNVDPQNLLRFTEQGPVAEHFVLSHGEQRAELAMEKDQPVVRLDHFDAGALLNVVTSNDTVPMADGQLTGEVWLPVPEGRPLRADVKVEQLVLTGQPLGDLAVKASGTEGTGYEGTVNFSNGPNKLDADANYRGAGPSAALDAHADVQFPDIAFLQPFVGAYLDELGGGVSGTLDLSTQGERNELHGELTFTEADFGLTGMSGHYSLRKETVRAEGDAIHFDEFTLLDSLGNTFVLDGRIHAEELDKLRFDLALKTDSFQLMQRPAKTGEMIYGDVLTALDLRITGTSKEPAVNGEIGILPGTDLSVVLPGSKVELVESEGIVEFTSGAGPADTALVATSEERLRDSLQAQMPQAELDLRIRVDPRAAFSIVIDPTTGDRATFKGEGDLRLRYSPQEAMRINGPFTVSEGGYTLEFYGLVKKRFDLVPGSQVVWDGDPIGARMDIKARYISETYPIALVESTGETVNEAERNRLDRRLPFEVMINIGGTVRKPDVTFGIDLDRKYRNDYPAVSDELDRLARAGQEEQRNRQVFGLLVFNSFVEDQPTSAGQENNLVTSAAANSVSGIMTDQLNKVAGHLVKDVDIEVGVGASDPAQANTAKDQTRVDYKVRKSFLNKRLSFEVGGSFNTSNENSTATGSANNSRAGEYAIIYDLTADGQYRARAFSENAYDLYDGEITDSGVALMYTKDLDATGKRRQKRVLKREAREQAPIPPSQPPGSK